MGRYGQAILTIVGTVVGAYFGYPALGAALGSLAGGALFPPQLPTVQGPRLSDITTTGATVGVPIPRGWGTFPAAGCIIWQGDVREVIVSEDVGGKGGPEQTVETPTYFQDFALGLNDGEIAGVRRIWANGKILYDRTPQRSDEALSAFNSRLAQSDALDEIMAVYLGTETQEPDPTIEAAEGMGEISAFRGLAYLMFTNWQCLPEDGNRIPQQWKVECYTAGAALANDVSEYANEVLYEWDVGNAIPMNALNVHQYEAIKTGLSSIPVSGFFDTLGEAIAACETARGRPYEFYTGYSLREPGESYDQHNVLIAGTPVSGRGGGADVTDVFLAYNHFRPSQYIFSETSNYWCTATIPLDGAYYWAAGVGITGHDTEGAVWRRYDPPGEDDGFMDVQPACGAFMGANGSYDCAIRVRRIPQAPPSPCAGASMIGENWCVDSAGQLVRAGEWVLDTSQDYLVLQVFEQNTAGFQPQVETYPLGPALPEGHINDTQAFWEAAYTRAALYGYMPEGLTYGVHYPALQSFGYKRTFSSATVTTNKIPLTDIIRDLSLEAGMLESDLAMTDLADLRVIGYVRTRVMTARAAIDPLRSFGFFDCYESNRQLKFVRRGRGIVDAIGEDELGVHVVGDEPPSKVTTRKLMDYDLPRQVRIHYMSQSRDYEAGQQDSPIRIETSAVNDMDFELPIVLEDDEAAQIASVLWADLWASRWVHAIQVDAHYQHLEPTDCIAVPVDGNWERMRIVAITDALPNVRKLELVRDDDGAYISYAVAEEPPIRIPPLAVVAPTELVLLDLPPLRDEDDDAGLYAAARIMAEDSVFRGAGILRSSDGGANYTRIASVGSETTMGTLVQDAPDGPTTIWDEGNSIYVDLQNGSLSSRTADAVLTGANAAAIGGHGYWEIIQFRDVTQVTETIFQLTGLLRGRRATEHNVGLAAQGDKFVMLSTGTLSRIPLDLALVGKAMLYKAVTAGLPIDSATVTEFTGAGEALKPFTPGRVLGERNTALDLTITWIRRGRFGETLQPGTDVALSEEVEDYEIDILNSAGTVVRTISVSEETTTYSANQQQIDLGAPQVDITVRVYQISARVGRGHYAQATL